MNLLNYLQAYFTDYQPFILGGTPDIRGINIGLPIISHVGDAVEQQCLEAHNLQRAALNRNPLLLHGCLTNMALYQVQYMYKNGLTHIDIKSPEYYYVTDRANKMGCHLGSFGENAAVGYTTVPDVMEGWMNSQGHKVNILHPTWKLAGFAREGNYWCAVFGG